MRKSRVLAVTFLVALFVGAPGAFAKVCHPKKPITCNSAEFSRLTTVVAPAAAKKATSVKTKAPVKVQHAMLCGPWVHWRCFGTPLG